MFSIFSPQNLQTFLRRKNLRPPSRGGPPGPERPPKRDGGRSPPERGPSPAGRSPDDGVLVSSAIILLHLSAGFFAGLRESKTRTPKLVLHTNCRTDCPKPLPESLLQARVPVLRQAPAPRQRAAHLPSCASRGAV